MPGAGLGHQVGDARGEGQAWLEGGEMGPGAGAEEEEEEEEERAEGTRRWGEAMMGVG